MRSFEDLRDALDTALKEKEPCRVGDWEAKPVDEETVAIRYLNKQIARISTPEYLNCAELKLYTLYKKLGEESPAFLYTVCKTCMNNGIEIWCDDFLQWGRSDFELPHAGNAVIPFGAHDISSLDIVCGREYLATITPAVIGNLRKSPTSFASKNDMFKGVFLFQKKDSPEAKVVSADMAREYIDMLASEQSLFGQEAAPLSFIAHYYKFNCKVYDGKIFMTDYWQRKYHMEIPIGGDLVYGGYINIEAPTEEELPMAEDIRGTFWIEKTEKGWDGKFTLAPEIAYEDSTGRYAVFTTDVHRKEDPELLARLDGHFDPVVAQMLWERSQPVQLEAMSRMEGKLEEYIRHDVNETHHWTQEYKSSDVPYFENPVPRYMRQAVKSNKEIC